MRKVPLEQLTPDMELGKPVCIGTSVLINVGTKDLDRYNVRLRKLGITHLYVEDYSSDDIDIDDIIADNTRLKCKKTLESSFKQIRTRFSVDMNQISTIANSLLDEILSHSNILFNLNEIGNIGDNTLDHSVNTTIYAICLAMQLGYTRSEIMELAQGTLLHDIGKTALDSRILFKPERLSDEEFEHVKQHAQLGYDMLGRDKRIPELCKHICLFHHERIDGSGYPFGLAGDEISEYAKIAAIVDVYEALTVNRCYHQAVSPQHAIDILTQEAATKFDIKLTAIFMQNIAAYPNGTTVLLSTGQYAIVKSQNPSFPLRPIVRTVTINNGKCVPLDEINLLTTLNMTIIDSDVIMPANDSKTLLKQAMRII